MHVHSEKYIQRCIDIGVLTAEAIHKYPLRSANIAVVLKLYAHMTHQPYTIDNQRFDILDEYKVYMTDGGLVWLRESFKTLSLGFLKKTFTHLFANVTTIEHMNKQLEPFLANFKGLKGVQPKAGSKQAAVIIRSYGKNNRIQKEFNYPELRLAREALLDMTRFYPLEQFKLYRIRKLTKKGKVTYYKEEVPIILEASKRGHTNNLPTLRREL
jgi:hypothetical protein